MINTATGPPPERGFAAGAESTTAQRRDSPARSSDILDLLPRGVAEGEQGREQLVLLVAAAIPSLKPEAASWLLSWFDEDFQAQVALRAALRGRFIPQTIDRLSALLGQKLGDGGQSDGDHTRAMLSVLMNNLGPGPRRAILDTLDAIDAEMAREAKEAVVDFEDILSLDDQTLERLLHRIKMSELALALQGASSGLLNRVLSLRSARSARILKEEIAFNANADPEAVAEVKSRIARLAHRVLRRAETANQEGEP